MMYMMFGFDGFLTCGIPGLLKVNVRIVIISNLIMNDSMIILNFVFNYIAYSFTSQIKS